MMLRTFYGTFSETLFLKFVGRRKLMQIVHGNQSLIPWYCSILVSFQLQVWYLININARLVLWSRSIIYLRWVKLKFTSWDKKKSIGTQKLKKNPLILYICIEIELKP